MKDINTIDKKLVFRTYHDFLGLGYPESTAFEMLKIIFDDYYDIYRKYVWNDFWYDFEKELKSQNK